MRWALAAFLVSFGALETVPASAQDASPWVADQHSSVRLVAGSRTDGVLLGGIAFKLQDGWKTYWRTPGDSGVPPRFDFSGSDNIATVSVLWPAPMQFPDGAGGTSFGYKHQLVLPLRIMAKQPDKPVTLRAAISYAVCEKLCVPVEAKSELAFTSSASTEDAALMAALQAVPQPARIGDANVLTVRGVWREGNTVLVDVTAPANTETALFVEGPTLDWALPPPQLVEKTPDGRQRFSFPLEGLPSGAKPEGAALKLTLVGAGHAYEVDTTLD
ncbi:MAG: protein-disulfide reductase DsbD domain-containing protein [Pseudomonadota bacterium]|jgi:DsbC/DsbD-like thiol-disulfide interchange protein